MTEWLPASTEERRGAFLAFTSVVGLGVLGYVAGTAIRDGDLFATVPRAPEAAAGPALVGALALFGLAARDAAEEYGWAPLVVGSLGLTAAVLGIRAVRG